MRGRMQIIIQMAVVRCRSVHALSESAHDTAEMARPHDKEVYIVVVYSALLDPARLARCRRRGRRGASGGR